MDDAAPEAPLSLLQEQLWFVEQLEPERTLYMEALGLRLLGDLDVPAFERSVQEVVRRHEVLRTTFPMVAGRPVQRVRPAPPISLTPAEDLSALDEREREAALLRRSQELAELPCDLARGPLVRCTLLRLDDRDHAFVLAAHHTVMDGWSMGVILREIEALYEAFLAGRPSPLPEPELQSSDYALWERDLLAEGHLDEDIRHWTARLAGAPQVLELPADHPRPPVKGVRGRRLALPLGDDLAPGLHALCRRLGVTAYAVLVAAWAAVVHRYTGRTDLVLGMPAANRDRPEMADLVGFFTNTLPLRVDVSGRPTFAELVGRCGAVSLEALEHQHLALEKVVELVRPDRDPGRTPLVQHLLALKDPPIRITTSSGLAMNAFEVPRARARFDTILEVQVMPDRLRAWAEYDSALFEPETVERFVRHYANVLRAGIADPEQRVSALCVLAPDEVAELTRPAAAEPWPERPLGELLTGAAARFGPRPALAWDGGHLDHAELEARANRLAGHLAALGAGPEVRVGICLRRSPETVVAVLAVLKAGAAYVPLDPGQPPERLATIMDDAGVELVVTAGELLDRVEEGGRRAVCLDRLPALSALPAAPPPARALPGSLAYVLYTSGTTGRPKGVLVENRSVAAFIAAAGRLLGVGPDDRVVQFASLGYDVSVLEILLPLLHGACVCVPGEDEGMSAAGLADFLTRHRVTIADLPPRLVGLLPPATLPDLQALFIGGEPFPAEVAAAWAGAGRRFYNAYGTTETTVSVTAHRCARGERAPVPIGRPMANHQALVLDGELRPVPAGAPGELHVAGPGVARGYLGQPALTAERFLPNPFSTRVGERLYRTGDLVRWNARGELEFLGRLDAQVKVRGVRVEPAEVEAVLALHPLVAEAAVVAADGVGGTELVAYVRPAGGGRAAGPLPGELRDFLAQRLPHSMVPAAFHAVAAIPRGPAGRPDPDALAAASPPAAAVPARPDPLRDLLADIWCEVMGVERVEPDDDFFELGGHSMLAARLAERLRESLEIELPLRSIFENPTLAELADEIRRANPQLGRLLAELAGIPEDRFAELLAELDAGAAGGDGRRETLMPLSPAQEQFWVMERLAPGRTTYTIPFTFHVRGPLDVDALRHGINGVVARHDSLRTTFVWLGDEGRQCIAPELRLEVPLFDLSGPGWSPADRAAEARRLEVEAGRHVFDLARGPLLLAQVVRLAPREHLVFLNFHHLVCDEVAMTVFTRELTELYRSWQEGRPPVLPELPFQVADYMVWEQEWLRDGNQLRLERFWRRQLAGAGLLELPTDHPRPPRITFDGTVVDRRAPRALYDACAELARHSQATPFGVYAAATAELLHRLSGQEDLLIGTPVENRNRPGAELLVGYFVNMAPLRVDCSGDVTFRELLHRVRDTIVAAYAHQGLPIASIVRAVRPPRLPNRLPLVQVSCTMQLDGYLQLDLPGCTYEYWAPPRDTSRYDMSFHAQARRDHFWHALELNTNMWDVGTGERLLAELEAGLGEVTADPDRPLASYRFRP